MTKKHPELQFKLQYQIVFIDDILKVRINCHFVLNRIEFSNSNKIPNSFFLQRKNGVCHHLDGTKVEKMINHNLKQYDR